MEGPAGSRGLTTARKLLAATAAAALTLTEATLSGAERDDGASGRPVAATGSSRLLAQTTTTSSSSFASSQMMNANDDDYDNSIKLASQLLPNMMINNTSPPLYLSRVMAAAGVATSGQLPTADNFYQQNSNNLNSNESTWSLLMSTLFYDQTTEPDINIDESQPGEQQQMMMMMVNINWSNFILALILIMLILTTMIGNSFVIIAILIERNLRTIGNYLVLSLAFADLFVAILVMPLAGIYQILEKWTLGELLCDVWTSADVFCCTASILHLLAIALDRYWAVTRVDYIRCQRNEKRILLMISFVWMFAGVISLAPILGWKDDKFQSRLLNEKECLVSQDISFQIVATSTSFYFPLTLTLIFYWKIYQVARKRIRRKPGNRVKISLQHPSSSSSISSPGSKTQLQYHKTKQQTIYQSIVECSANRCKGAGQKYTTASKIAGGSANVIDQPLCQCSCHFQTRKVLQLEQAGKFNLNASMTSAKFNGAAHQERRSAGEQGKSPSGNGAMMMIPNGGLPDGAHQPVGGSSSSCSSTGSSLSGWRARLGEDPNDPGRKEVEQLSGTAGSLDGTISATGKAIAAAAAAADGIDRSSDGLPNKQQKQTAHDNKSTGLDNDNGGKPNDNPQIDMLTKSNVDNQIFGSHIMGAGQSNDGAIQTMEARNSTKAGQLNQASCRVQAGAKPPPATGKTGSGKHSPTTSGCSQSSDSRSSQSNPSPSPDSSSLGHHNGSVAEGCNKALPAPSDSQAPSRTGQLNCCRSLRAPNGSCGTLPGNNNDNCCSCCCNVNDVKEPKGKCQAVMFEEEEEEEDAEKEAKGQLMSNPIATAQLISFARNSELSTVVVLADERGEVGLEAASHNSRVVAFIKRIPLGLYWLRFKSNLLRQSSSQLNSSNFNSAERKANYNERLVIVDGDGKSRLINSAGSENVDRLAGVQESCKLCLCPLSKVPHVDNCSAPINQIMEQDVPEGPTQIDDDSSGPNSSANMIIASSTANIATNTSAGPTNRPLAQAQKQQQQVGAAGSVSAGEGIESKRERKAAKTLAIITGVFVMCWLPFFVMAITMPLLDLKPHKYVFALLLWLGYINSMLNPIIYTIFSPDFRKAFKRLICRTNEELPKGHPYGNRSSVNSTPRSTPKKETY